MVPFFFLSLLVIVSALIRHKYCTSPVCCCDFQSASALTNFCPMAAHQLLAGVPAWRTTLVDRSFDPVGAGLGTGGKLG